MNYEIKISGTSGIDTTQPEGFRDCVEYFQIMSDTVVEYARERNTSVLFRVELKFRINKETKKFAKELFDWSKLITGEIYRDFEVTITDPSSEGGLIRHVAIKSMFVEDYSETFDERKDDNGEADAFATLKLIQKGGKLSEISNDC